MPRTRRLYSFWHVVKGWKPFFAAAARERAILRAGQIGAADLPHLAVAHELVHGAERVLDRRRGIGAVELIEVDIVGAEALQARLGRARDIARRGAAASRHRHAELGGDHHGLAAGPEDAAEPFLRQALAIGIGRVEEGDAKASAFSTTGTESSKPMRRPKLLQPSPSSDTDGPEFPSLRNSKPCLLHSSNAPTSPVTACGHLSAPEGRRGGTRREAAGGRGGAN